MSRFITDCSVTMAWCFDDEANDYTNAILRRLLYEEAVVPSLWPLEVGNVLLVGERRKRITPADSAKFIGLLNALPIKIDEETSRHAFANTLSLGRTHALSAYDAAYLELALRLGAPLATQDAKLKSVAAGLGVVLL